MKIFFVTEHHSSCRASRETFVKAKKKKKIADFGRGYRRISRTSDECPIRSIPWSRCTEKKNMLQNKNEH